MAGDLAAKNRYGALWHRGPVGAFVTDATGTWIDVNDQWLAITGLTRAAALQDGLHKLLHDDDRGMFAAGQNKLTPRGETSEVKFRIRHAEHGWRWVSSRTIALSDTDGNVTGHMGTLVDVTERRVAEDALRQSEELHRLTMQNMPGAAVGLYDLNLRCLLLSGMESRGMSTEVAHGKHISELCPPDSLADLMPGVQAALEGKEFAGEFPVGEVDEWWSYSVAPFRNSDGEISGVVVVAQDITAKRAAEEQRRRADNMFRVAFDEAPIGMAIVGSDATFERSNRALEELLGLPEGHLDGQSAFAVVHQDDQESARAAFANALENGEAAVECRMIGPAGKTIWVDARGTLVRDDDGRPLHVLAQFRDVTERRELIGRLEHLVEHDPLTSLLNRRGFERALATQLAGRRRYGEVGSLLLVDLDGFKAVNDTLGHAGGDDLISACANALVARLRETDVIARLGGDEFAVILPAQEGDEAELVAAELIASVTRTSSHFADPGPKVTASVGIASLSSSNLTPGEALLQADRAMYAAKRAGKNCAQRYDARTRTGIPAGSSAKSEAA